MFRVALVQNQSEMAHYGYADARPLIADLGYEPILFTADNVDALGQSLARGGFDAVVFASNALNDKTIRAETLKEEFRQEFRNWISKRHGCLCLHQLRLAALSHPTLGFLPPPLDAVCAAIRPSSEKSADGELALEPRARDHILALYPNRIEAAVLRESCLQFRSLPGLYWHSWKEVNLADWEVLLVDPSYKDGSRVLLLMAREPRDYRVVLSALTLDWQKQRSLLQNILTYVVEGRHNTAILLDKDNRSAAFEYLVGTLESRHYPFQRYFVGQDLDGLSRHIQDNVHHVLLLGPLVGMGRLPKDLVRTINDQVASGSLKLLTVEGQEPETKRFSVAGRERSALRLLQTAEFSIQAELRNGFIDGSFWSTTETLQTMRGLSHSIGTYADSVQGVLRSANEHDRDGSYDEVFGVTCAFLWMRGTFLDVNSKETVATTQWIRRRMQRYDTREQVLAYLTLAELGLLHPLEEQALRGVLTELRPELLSEIDLVVYLRAALVAKQPAVLPALVNALKTKQIRGTWIDLATTATAVTTLVDVLMALRSEASTYGDLKAEIEGMVFRGIIDIQEALERSLAAPDPNTVYPWDGKASTTLKCIQAWLKFEELVDLPVYELVETLSRFDAQATGLVSGRQALSVLDDLKKENTQLRHEVTETTTKYLTVQRRAKQVFSAWLFAATFGYLLAAILWATVTNGGTGQLLQILKVAFIDAWAVHVAVAAALAAYLAVPWHRWLKGKG